MSRSRSPRLQIHRRRTDVVTRLCPNMDSLLRRQSCCEVKGPAWAMRSKHPSEGPLSSQHNYCAADSPLCTALERQRSIPRATRAVTGIAEHCRITIPRRRGTHCCLRQPLETAAGLWPHQQAHLRFPTDQQATWTRILFS